jgi:hypothetical protein
MTKQDRQMVKIVRAINAGKWTDDLPNWANANLTVTTFDDEHEEASALRAVQTAEAYTVLRLSADGAWDMFSFLRACGLVA